MSQELADARCNAKALEDDRVFMKALRDKAMDKAIWADRLLMKRPGVAMTLLWTCLLQWVP